MFPKRYLGIIPSYSVPFKKRGKKSEKKNKENKRTRVLIMRDFLATKILSNFFKV
jgi:hypothetical protein